MSDISKDFDGFYQRYSDDFILVLNIKKLIDRYGEDYVEKVNENIEDLSKKKQNIFTIGEDKNLFYQR